MYTLRNSPPTRRQHWFAAVLVSPGTFLSHGSAGACYGFYRFERGYEVVTRSGRSRRRRHGRVLVFWSTILTGNTTCHAGIPITTAARVVVDIAPGLGDEQLGRAFGVERAMDSLGAVAGPLLAAPLIVAVGYRWLFALSIVPGLLAAAAVLVLVAEVPHLPFRSGAFGFVFDRGCLQGMPRWLWPEYFVEVSRLLMPGGVLQLMLSKPERPSALSIKGLKARIRRAMPGKRSRGRLSPEGRVLRLRPASFQTLRREEFSFRTNTGRVRHFAHWVFQKT